MDFTKDIDFNSEFQKAFDLVENTNDCIFITGRAGTGKSTLLKILKQKTKKNAVVLAPTGVSAINVQGQTIHSFFKFPPKIIQKETPHRLRGAKLFKRIELIIIDEVSMVRADLMDGIDQAMRINRGFDIPFGGAQVVMFGDLFQLPPVIRGEQLQDFFKEHYGSAYFFSADVFRNIKLNCIELTRIYRQSDKDFIGLLEKIRNKKLLSQDLDILNSRLTDKVMCDDAITLTTTNELAARMNEKHLEMLDGLEYSYQAEVSDEFEESFFPTEFDLKLKAGAQVMLIRNDPEKRWVNGTIALVEELGSNSIKIAIGANIYELFKQEWSRIVYKYDAKNNAIIEEVVGTFQQFPLRLAWAITIHKSQGKTFDNVVIDLGWGAFAHGQVYVALSRCSSLKGIVLKRPVRLSDIIFDQDVYKFREKFIMACQETAQ
ncbi:MAG: AAA family ATPase [Candidatus Omnitrophica bacterium]|nr:AAA family ATPase [Candidatus Omnitrophota bacterium]